MNVSTNLLDGASRGPRDGKLWLLHAVANPLLFALFAGWLLIPESHVWQLGASLLGLLGLGALGLWVHAATLAYLADREAGELRVLKSAFGRVLRNLIPFALCVAAAYFLWQTTDRLDLYRETLPAFLRSTIPLFARRHVTRAEIANAYAAAIFLVRWIFWPALLLPFVASVARDGFPGFVEGIRALRILGRGSYWLAIAVASLTGILLLPSIVAWRPFAHDATVTFESVSMVVRLLVAFVIGIASWLGVSSMVGSTLWTGPDAGGQAAH